MNELAVREQGAGVLARVGTPEERQYLLGIMAEQLGIPAGDAGRRDVQAVIANAAQRTMEFGWMPGVHMHVQRFKNKRLSQQAGRDIYQYTLVDGEKAWKDSLTRWRTEFGKEWYYQRKPMTREEVEQEARLMGYTESLPTNAYGIWSRIVIKGVHDHVDDYNPMWSAGVWLGKIKTGTFWSDDALPTGVSSRDVALRRADKRAAMQSELSLLPVDARAPEERMSTLTDTLRREAQYKVMTESVPDTRHKAQVEDDGEILFAATDGPLHGQADDDEDTEEASWEAIADDTPGARPDTPGARSTDQAARPEQCPHCHAPAGKPHANNCPTRLAEMGEAAPEPESTAPEITFALADDSPLDGYAQDTVRAYRVMHGQGVAENKRMTLNMYNSLRNLIPMALGDTDDGDAYKVLLWCLCGEEVDSKHLPGKGVGQLREVLIDPESNKQEIEILQQILMAAHVAREPA